VLGGAAHGLSTEDMTEGVASGAVPAPAAAAELPPEMRPLSPADRRAYAERKNAEREGLQRQLNELSARRDAYIKDHAKRGADPGASSFDDAVNHAIEKQGKSFGVRY
jgi:hypothetical protein